MQKGKGTHRPGWPWPGQWGPLATNPIIWRMGYGLPSRRDSQKDVLSSLFCFVLFSWLDHGPGSSLALPGILMDFSSPWKQFERAWLASGLLSSSGFPGPHGVFACNWSVEKFWCPGQKVEFLKSRIYESSHSKAKHRSWNLSHEMWRPVQQLKTELRGWKEQSRLSTWRKRSAVSSLIG